MQKASSIPIYKYYPLNEYLRILDSEIRKKLSNLFPA